MIQPSAARHPPPNACLRSIPKYKPVFVHGHLESPPVASYQQDNYSSPDPAIKAENDEKQLDRYNKSFNDEGTMLLTTSWWYRQVLVFDDCRCCNDIAAIS
jgi:hypothetical protein